KRRVLVSYATSWWKCGSLLWILFGPFIHLSYRDHHRSWSSRPQSPTEENLSPQLEIASLRIHSPRSQSPINPLLEASGYGATKSHQRVWLF
ncbi:hypothetical protein K435DRAFT_773383, partial [Dendrothele bispora CBS 962.96]